MTGHFHTSLAAVGSLGGAKTVVTESGGGGRRRFRLGGGGAGVGFGEGERDGEGDGEGGIWWCGEGGDAIIWSGRGSDHGRGGVFKPCTVLANAALVDDDGEGSAYRAGREVSLVMGAGRAVEGSLVEGGVWVVDGGKRGVPVPTGEGGGGRARQRERRERGEGACGWAQEDVEWLKLGNFRRR